MDKKQNNLKGSLILVFAAFLWGMAFVAQTKAAQKGVTPFLFNFLRSGIGSLFLFLLLLLKKKKTGKNILPTDPLKRKKLLLRCLLCGVFLTISINLQQLGLSLYPLGVAAEARGSFLTALYVVIVPLTALFFRKKVELPIWGAVALALVGVYLLSLSNGFSGIYVGDVVMVCCAVSFTGHIMCVDGFHGDIDGMLLSCIQFAVACVLSGIFSFATEEILWSAVAQSIPEILYLGIVSSGIAYTLQIVGQGYAEPAVASLSMSLESVFGALGGWAISGSVLSTRELIGCVLMFVAIILAQLPEMLASRKKDSL